MPKTVVSEEGLQRRIKQASSSVAVQPKGQDAKAKQPSKKKIDLTSGAKAVDKAAKGWFTW